LYYIFGYRKKVVIENVNNSFPELKLQERIAIVNGFYGNLSDILVEGLKGFTMNQTQLQKRYKLINPELLDEFYDLNMDVICVGSHYANWEWGIMAAPQQIKHRMKAIYTPLTNKRINNYTIKNRSRYGTEMIPKSDVRKAISEKNENPTAYLFGGDQSPARIRNVHWMEILNQDTAVLKGAEYFAKVLQCPVIYFDVQRVRRGYYTVEVSVLFQNPSGTLEGEITEKYMRTLEKIIRRKPEDFLWSHKRWKHKREPEVVTTQE
jgi:KDO2-lipid IV(A) lauroyltransferase